jgi:hypothetical protein
MLERPLENSRTPERSCLYDAECEVGGQHYSARSRHGAANELARVLVCGGVPDQPVEIRQVGLKGCISYRSLHELAAGLMKKAPRCRCAGCDGNLRPISSPLFGGVLPKTGVKCCRG